VGLLLAFGVNLGVFAATYDQQARVDAQLTLGADVVASAPAGALRAHRLEQRIAQVPGVAGTTALDHSYAYVGPDLQDTFGVDAATLTSGTTLRDSYFIGGTAQHLLAELRAHRDGILVSKETVTDYSLNIGDLLKLRVLDHATGQLRVTPFHVVGIVQEFPSAPRDSFMVTNLDYLLASTHDPGANVVFAKTHGDAAAVARRVAEVARPAGASVKDITTQTAQTVSSITTVDMSGIAKIEEAFAVILAAAAMALFVVLGLAERKHEFATMASIRQLRPRDQRISLERGRDRARGWARAGRAARLAAGGDARRHVATRVRPSARPSRRAVVLPRGPRDGRGARRTADDGCRRSPPPAPAARPDPARAIGPDSPSKISLNGIASGVSEVKRRELQGMGRVITACVAVLLGTLAFSSIAGAITYGSPDGGGHPEVGALLAPVAYSDGTWETCSGTLISPTVFLTAAHCDQGVSRVAVTFESSYVAGSGKTYWGTWHADPRFSRGAE